MPAKEQRQGYRQDSYSSLASFEAAAQVKKWAARRRARNPLAVAIRSTMILDIASVRS